jgi:hypothetical protein
MTILKSRQKVVPGHILWVNLLQVCVESHKHFMSVQYSCSKTIEILVYAQREPGRDKIQA